MLRVVIDVRRRASCYSAKRLLIASLLGLLAVGCQPNTPAVDAPTKVPAPAVTKSADPAPTTAIPLRVATWDEIERTIASHQGKIVVLDVWSSWCVPCIEEFPHLVQLHRDHADQVVCLSLNCNYIGAADEPPEKSIPEIEKFLREQKATFDNIVCRDADEQLFMKLGAASVPIVRVYDRQGKLAKQFVNDDDTYGENGFTYTEHILPLVQSLLD